MQHALTIAMLGMHSQSATVPRTLRPPEQALLRLRPQQLAVRHRYASVCMVTAAEDSAPASVPVAERKPEAVTPGWQTAIDLLQSGKVFSPKIVGVNRSGVVVLVGKMNGFVPYKLMDKAKLPTTPFDPETWSKSLVGTKLSVKVTQVIVPERRLICSEKAAMLDAAARELAIGEVLSGSVISIHDFGAFIELSSGPFKGAEVILPVREVSWDWIANVNAVLSRGDNVQVVVTAIQPPPKAKVVVSLKRLAKDPLKETLDQVLPLEAKNGNGDVSSVPATIPAAVEDILDELSRQAGVAGVQLGRRVEERRTVSQDLELWMTRDPVADGYNLVARTGRIVQEIHVTTEMEAHEMKATVQRVLKKVS